MKILFFLLTFSFLFLVFFRPSSASQQDEILVTILYDNYTVQEGLETDWGFSCLIEGTEKTILFDTGTKSDLFFRNVEALKADLDSVELVVISHDHYDHTGSLVPFLKKKSDVSVYLLTSFRDVLFQEVKQTGAKIVSIQAPVEICENVHTTGEMGDQIKEQTLILDTSQGLVVITGCAHPGIVEIVKKAKQILNKDINLVFGGFHLMQTPAAQVKEIIADFRELGVKKVGATHCTGDDAIQMFREEWGENFVELGVGRKISITLHE
jgi:7,8-dihydropterin-6-yl-methyl-4-(beta-D-ribofuranosyl)aminobenzene 5'-phosphate synthase